jgi:alpha-L-fucosidase 2
MPASRRSFLQGAVSARVFSRLSRAQHFAASPKREELWYLNPAERWFQALPVGNGRLGGMVFGGVPMERIALSESTAWSGGPAENEINPGALSHLNEIRQLFFAGKYDEAQALCRKFLPGRSKNFGTNLPLPELQLTFGAIDSPTDYRRSLSLDEAIARISFRSGDVRFTREVFASHPDRILAIRIACNLPERTTFKMNFSKGIIPNAVRTRGRDTLILDGHAWEHMHSTGHDGVSLQIHARVIAEGGHVTPSNQFIDVHGADTATVLLAIVTSFGGSKPEDKCTEALARATTKSFAQLRSSHIADYQPLYRRTAIDLGETQSATRQQPTDVRRKALANGAHDPELAALFFQYGRYLMIAGSRADSPLPLALQGIWNDGLASSMGWTDDFHLDINTQQNYWPAEVCNLGECQAPLFRLIEVIKQGGRATAKEMYGAPGWVVHTVTNPWGFTAPGSPGWGIFVTGGIWIPLQMWDHWTFNGDIQFLRDTAYPVLRGAADFFLSYMATEPKHGWLVTGPSDSPENWYITPAGGHASESMGPTCDRVFVHALCTMCIEASKLLSVDPELRQRLEDARAKLPPFQIGRHGQLQEWLEDFEEAEPNHRHTAHLVALYPEHQVSPRSTPELARAAEVTIERRMHAPRWEQSEWGRANLVVYYSRLLKGDEAHKYFVSLLAQASEDNLLTYSSGGVAGAEQNIFAIDGNTAGSAGIAEMLVQSQDGQIELLPALPSAWPNGSIRGLCARGGFVIDIAWNKGRLLSASILSKNGNPASVRYGDRLAKIDLRPGRTARLQPESFNQKE